jgi:sulfatase maturation enzyme AslB (radical SAM superfamily)
MRILCLGNNTEDTDIKTTQLADQAGSINHGLLNELDGPLDEILYQNHGFYHSTIFDISWPNLLKLAENFDQVIMLDQPKKNWSHPNAWINTIKLVSELGNKGRFIDHSYLKYLSYFKNLLNNNKAFCIHPFIQLHVVGQNSVLCCLSSEPVAETNTIKDFGTDARYQNIRNKILQGDPVTNCKQCYKVESQGLVSDRQIATIEWSNRLNLSTLDDLKAISSPVFYDIRPSNKCNLMCRMCRPEDSHLIEKEYKAIGLIPNTPIKTLRATGFDIIQYDKLEQVTIAGGEPTLMPELYQWLDDCVANGRTNFGIQIQTNGNKISARLKKLVKNFSDISFAFSIDGYGQLNRYIRWPSDWDSIIENLRYFYHSKHPVVITCTISIYNVWNLGDFFEFLDHNFPNIYVNFSIVSSPSCMAPTLFPDHAVALKGLLKAKQSRICKNHNKKIETILDSLINHFSQNPSLDVEKLKDFFDINDKLDKSRSVYLKDYIPYLEKFRTKIACLTENNL